MIETDARLQEVFAMLDGTERLAVIRAGRLALEHGKRHGPIKTTVPESGRLNLADDAAPPGGWLGDAEVFAAGEAMDKALQGENVWDGFKLAIKTFVVLAGLGGSA